MSGLVRWWMAFLVAWLAGAGAAMGAANYQGLWYASPAESEAGWGLNVAHQGEVIFATWFTYDANGNAWWLSMTALQQPDGSFAGKLYQTGYQTAGIAFGETPFDPAKVTATEVGTARLAFTDVDNGTFAYTVGNVTQTKAITRQKFAAVPTCTWGALADLSQATNYQDLWWAPGGAESGWGINLTHQGDAIFATWFTYGAGGKPMWLSATALKTGPGVYAGDMIRTNGPAFSAAPFDPKSVGRSVVGSAKLTFANGNAGLFEYTVDGVTQSKAIARQVFRPPGTACGVAAAGPSPAQGIWRGTTSTGNNVTMIVVDDGSYYLAYRYASMSEVSGGMSGASTASGGTFVGSGGINVPFTARFAGDSGSVTGTYVPRSSLQLTLGQGATAETATTTYDASYDAPADLAALAGSYRGVSGHELEANNATATIDAGGKMFIAGGCNLSGTAVPRGSAGVFDFTVATISGICLGGPGKPRKGVLVLDRATGSFVALAPFGSDIFMLSGRRQ